MERERGVVSAVGIVSIAVGVLNLCWRGGPLLVAPAAFLRWMKGMSKTNGRTRVFGTFMLILGATMVWAGASEGVSFDPNSQGTLLAFILLVFGLVAAGFATVALVVFPAFFRGLAEVFVPSEPTGRLTGWRILGLAQVIVSWLFIYFGALAL